MTWKSLATVATVCAGLALASSSVPAKVGGQLKGDWLRANLPGEYTLVIYGFDVDVNAATDGNFSLSFLLDEMKGKWAVKGDQLCITLIEGQESQTACSVIHYDGRKYYSAAGIRFYAAN